MRNRLFPVSVWYGVGSVTPLFSQEKIEEDIKRISELGFRFIRYWVNWRDIEIAPHKYDSTLLEHLMETAARYNLKVIIQVYLEFAPDFLPQLYPDSVFVAHDGSKLWPQGSPGVCLDNPRARKHAEEFLRNLALSLKKFSNFYAWDVWSEPQIVQWVFRLTETRPVYCYCEHSIKRFRDWLKRKYNNDIEKLNYAWHRRFRSFEEVEPPRFVVLHYARENLDWIEFNIDKLKEDLEWRVRVIKEIDKEHSVTSHAATTSLLLHPLYGHPDDWRMAEVIDIWGTSLYPKHAHRTVDHVIDAFILDAIRSSTEFHGKEYWIGELQGGQGIGGLRIADPVTPEDIELWIWQSIAHGAKGINIYHSYPMMLGYESSGYGLLNLDGGSNDRARRAGEASKLIQEYEDLFLRARPFKREIAIVYSSHTHRWLWIAQQLSPEILSKSLLGVYRALYNIQLYPDFVHPEYLERSEEFLYRYKLVISPATFVISKEFANLVKKYIERGGVFVADARFGWVKEDGWVDVEIPAYGMKELFGGREKLVKGIQYPVPIRVAHGASEYVVQAHLYLQFFELVGGGEAIAFVDSDVAAVMNSFSKGKSYVFGMPLGYSYEVSRDNGYERLLEKLALEAGVSRLLELRPFRGSIEWSLLTTGSEDLVLILNFGSEVYEGYLSFNYQEVSRIRGIVRGESLSIENNEIKIKLRPRAVFIGYVER